MTRCKWCNETIDLNGFHWCSEGLAQYHEPPRSPCFICGTPTGGDVCARCASDCYEQRRAAIAKRRNPPQGLNPEFPPIQSENAGIARAAAGLSHFEPRLGAARFEP